MSAETSRVRGVARG